MNNSEIIGKQDLVVNTHKINFENFSEIINGKVIQHCISKNIRKINIDTRKLIVSPDAIFFAIKGKNHDSHKYLEKIYEKGIKQFVIENEDFDISKLPEANIILVNNSIQALQKFAAYHRNKFEIPILAITGSNGKTIIKEWLSQSLALKYDICKSPKSYNSQIGVPLSILELDTNHEYGIFEAGISLTDEMNVLEKIIKPTLGIFTNIGPAHEEGFKSDYIKVKEKAILFKNCNKIYYCKDYKVIDGVLKELYPNYINDSKNKLISWSTKFDNANYKVKYELLDSGNTLISINENKFEVPFKDPMHLENVIHCIVFLLNEFKDSKLINNSIKLFKSIPMRLSLKKGINGCQIIDDSYSNDLISLKAAIEFMVQKKFSLKKTIILSDFLQTANDKKNIYNKVFKLLEYHKIDKIIGIGKEISNYKLLFKDINSKFYETTDALLNDKTLNFKEELILVKGARKFNFEKIVNNLEEKNHNTILEIDLDSVVHNLNYFKSKLKDETKLMVMVKAFSYGSSGFEIPNLLEHHKVDYLGVAYADEGVRLRKNGIKTPIMVLNPTIDSFDILFKYNLEPELYSLNILKAFLEYSKNESKIINVHIKIDTGMHRLGFLENEVDEVINYLKANPKLKVKSIFSHLAGSESIKHDEFTKQQADTFIRVSNKIEKSLGYKSIRHILNTSGILRFPQYQYDMVRLGIGLHGIGVEKKYLDELKPVNTLSTVISQIKTLPKDSTIGYDRKAILKRNSKIAIIGIGYADGFSRIMGNKKCIILINDKEVPVIGNICMDMCMVDITDLENINEGDRVIIFGKNHSIDRLANLAGTISYEVLSQVNERVKRIYISN